MVKIIIMTTKKTRSPNRVKNKIKDMKYIEPTPITVEIQSVCQTIYDKYLDWKECEDKFSKLEEHFRRLDKLVFLENWPADNETRNSRIIGIALAIRSHVSCMEGKKDLNKYAILSLFELQRHRIALTKELEEGTPINWYENLDDLKDCQIWIFYCLTALGEHLKSQIDYAAECYFGEITERTRFLIKFYLAEVDCFCSAISCDNINMRYIPLYGYQGEPCEVFYHYRYNLLSGHEDWFPNDSGKSLVLIIQEITQHFFSAITRSALSFQYYKRDLTKIEILCKKMRKSFKSINEDATQKEILIKTFKDLYHIVGNVGFDIPGFHDYLSCGIALSLGSMLLIDNGKTHKCLESFVYNSLKELQASFIYGRVSLIGETSLWMIHTLCRNEKILNDFFINCLCRWGKPVNKKYLDIFKFLLSDYFYHKAFLINSQDLTFAPRYDEKNGLDMQKVVNQFYEWMDRGAEALKSLNLSGNDLINRYKNEVYEAFSKELINL